MAVGCFLLPVVTLILILRFVSQRGIRPPQRIPRGTALSIPPAGHARILARKLYQAPNGLAWQWTVVGDRNWTIARASGNGFVLDGAYPFNSRATIGGTHIWTVELDVVSRRDKPGYVVIPTSIEGTNGTMVSGVSSAPARSAASAASISIAKDVLISIPSGVRLAVVAGKPFTLEIKP